jgi:hypothetical protein
MFCFKQERTNLASGPLEAQPATRKSEQYCSDFAKADRVGCRMEDPLWSPKPCTKQF